jgi:uncharacterized protein
MRMCFRVSVLAGLLAFTALAVDWKALKPQGCVSDFAQVIDAASRARLEAYCAAVQRATSAEMALVTLPSLNGEPVEDVANTIFRAWGVGKKGTNEGVMLLLSINDRKSRLEVGYGLEPTLPDGFAGSVLRAMRPALRAGKYSDALMSAAETIGQTVAAAKHTAIDTQLPEHMRQDPGGDFPWGALIAGGVILLLIFRSRGPRGYGGGGDGGGFWAGMILGNVLSRSSWGSRGSGGFGGSDSGDGGFGGFGGGDSGGGGASSDW